LLLIIDTTPISFLPSPSSFSPFPLLISRLLGNLKCCFETRDEMRREKEKLQKRAARKTPQRVSVYIYSKTKKPYQKWHDKFAHFRKDLGVNFV
jgi:hypothetical protein